MAPSEEEMLDMYRKMLLIRKSTKSEIMVGLGEEPAEVLAVMNDLREAGCDYITIGQYLQPTPGRLPVHGYVAPAMFRWYEEQCLRKGFRKADCGPLVRSSYTPGLLSDPAGAAVTGHRILRVSGNKSVGRYANESTF